MDETKSNAEVMNQMIGGYWISRAIYVAAELSIADLLSGGPQTVEELAARTQTDSASLYRVLRALASVGIFAENGNRVFSLTPLADRLRSDVTDSQHAFAVMMGAEFYEAWNKLPDAVRTGEEAACKAFGMPFFQYMADRPDRAGLFDLAMNGIHGAESEAMLDAYDFSPFRTLIDVGGGSGQMLTATLRRHPGISGILFDLPDVVERARPAIAELGLTDRCRIVGGSFFSTIPGGCDAYVLRHIVHDWLDSDAVRILRNCCEAMAPESRLLVVENVITPDNEPCFGKWLDLMMLVVGGRERTEEEYRRLFGEAGLQLNRVVPTRQNVSVIEGMRAA